METDATQVSGMARDDYTQVAEQTEFSPGLGQGWSKAYTRSDASAYANISLASGTLLGGRYQILQTLGEGGMGAVFKARDREVDRIVALKVIRPELAGNDEILRRFRQELVLARKITHRNVVRIYDLGLADGLRFISMEYIEGRELAHLLRDEGKLAPKQAAEIMLQVCRGLAVAHAEGVIHRDLKPQNIMIDQQARAAVMDFGIAHSLETAALAGHGATSGLGHAGNLTMVGALLGTPRYMSPEQARGAKVDNRSDLFTVGLIFYELLTGDFPSSKGPLADMLRERSEQQIKLPTAIDPSVPRVLNNIVARCVQLDPVNRYSSAEEIIQDLELWLGIQKRHGTNWKLFAPAAAMILGLTGTLVYTFLPHVPVVHGPVKILVSDFANTTGNPILTGTLETLISTALEGASFITTYNRGDARKTATQLSGSQALSENSARLVARREGVGVVVGGSIRRKGDRYELSAEALDAISGKPIDQERATVSTTEQLNAAVGKIAAGFRKALGDAVPQSKQIAAAETFSSQSLEAAQQYAQAQELQWAGKWEQALKAYSRSIQLDPELGRAYAGMAVIYANQGGRQAAEKDFRLALSKMSRMSEREKYRTRGAYYLLERDYEKAIEQYKALERQFPADPAGIGNLALANFYARNMAGAVEEGRRVLAIYPNNILYLNNVGLFAMYAGDFDTAIRESERLLKMNPSFEKAYLCVGLSQLAKGADADAATTYKKLGTLSPWGASTSATALADMALFAGRASDASDILQSGITADTARHDSARSAEKWIMLGQAQLMRGEKEHARTSAERALGASDDENLLYPAAMILLETGRTEQALQLARKLDAKFEPDPQAYGKIIEAEVQTKRREYREAVHTFEEAQKIADTWIGRFEEGRAYLAAGDFTNANTEFELCEKRRGEATAVFLDDEPSWRYFAPVSYYLGRSLEGLGSPEAAQAYRDYLQFRGGSTNDELAADARKRLSAAAPAPSVQ
jgi:serine/threonine protein kinase/tetratricopeptide (TPR) repeat protein